MSQPVETTDSAIRAVRLLMGEMHAAAEQQRASTIGNSVHGATVCLTQALAFEERSRGLRSALGILFPNLPPEDLNAIDLNRSTGTPAEPCRDCGCDGAVFGPDPYESDINGDDTPVWMCDTCRTFLRTKSRHLTNHQISVS